MLEEFKRAVLSGDAECLSGLLEREAELKDRLNDPLFAFDTPALVAAAGRGHLRVIDVMLEAGADINARSRWWAGSFGVLDTGTPETAAYLIERGAVVDAHAASRLGMLERLRQLVAAEPEVVHARGGDGQTPLHFASSVEIAAFLLDHGAEIDARDVDHESTPAQYLVKSCPGVVRYLIGRGAKTDILMAAAVGDLELVRKHLYQNPDSIRMRVAEEFFPKQDPRSGGPVYYWTLGRNWSPHRAAREFGHEELYRFLMEHSAKPMQLAQACAAGDEATARALAAAEPNLVSQLSEAEREQIVQAAQDNNTAAVRLMLEQGWPVDLGGATPLHWASWHGNVEMAREILAHHPPLERPDSHYHAPPMGWACHGSENGWHPETGDYGGVVEALLEAGAKAPEELDGSAAVREVLYRHGVRE